MATWKPFLAGIERTMWFVIVLCEWTLRSTKSLDPVRYDNSADLGTSLSHTHILKESTRIYDLDINNTTLYLLVIVFLPTLVLKLVSQDCCNMWRMLWVCHSIIRPSLFWWASRFITRPSCSWGNTLILGNRLNWQWNLSSLHVCVCVCAHTHTHTSYNHLYSTAELMLELDDSVSPTCYQSSLAN